MADNGTGGLTVTQTGGESITFNNSYAITGTTGISFVGTKKLTGKPMQNGEFKFVIMEGDTKVAEGTNDANGDITFTEMVFGAADIGQHTYTIYEVAGSVEGMTYDATVYTVVISVTDDGEGSVDVELVSANTEELVFTNTFVPGTLEVKVPVTKTVENNGTGAMGPDGFKFVLKDTEGNVVAEAQSNAEGLAELLLSYNLDGIGTHIYTLSEVNTGVTGVTYDVNTYTVTVVVVQEADGQLKAQAAITDAAGQIVEQAAFVNSYTPPVTPPTGDMSAPQVYVAVFHISGLGLVLMLAVLVIDFKKKPLFKK